MNDLIKYLYSINDEKYRLFNKNIVKGNSPIIGVQIPKLRFLAKQIVKEKKIDEFFKIYEGYYFEEKMLKGLIIASDEEYFKKYGMDFMYTLDSWCLVDTFCNSCKFMKNNDYSNLAFDLIKKDEEFVKRCGYVFLLNFYLTDEYIDKIINVLDYKGECYYVNMAISWLISEAYIKYPKRIEELLNKKILSDFIQNKAIDKINDSYRVSDENKVRLSKLKYF